jgi:hypothetical protein
MDFKVQYQSLEPKYEPLDNEIPKSDYERFLRISKDFPLSEELHNEFAKIGRRRFIQSFESSLYTSNDDIWALIQAGIDQKPYTMNALKRMFSGTTTNGLKEGLVPELVTSGHILQDDSGRYTTYTVTHLGVQILFLTFLNRCRCNESGLCPECNGTKKCNCDDHEEGKPDEFCDDGVCWDCEGTGKCEHHYTMLQEIGGINRFEEFYEILLNGFL